jgi:hypothetical protein
MRQIAVGQDQEHLRRATNVREFRNALNGYRHSPALRLRLFQSFARFGVVLGLGFTRV